MTAARLLDDWGGLLDVTHPAIEHRPPSTAQADSAARVLRKVEVPANPGSQRESAHTPDAPPADPQRRARVALFRGKGIVQAERLADLLTERDDTLDDRRACAECASLHDGRCLQGRYPVGEADIYTLHRCAGFKPEEVSHD